MNKAVFMGRNGMIHNMPSYGLLNVSTCRLLDGAIPALNLLGQQGYILDVVTNEKKAQPGGIDYLNIVGQVENWIRDMVYSPIYFRYCYHHHKKNCKCRLPKPGLINALRDEQNIDLEQSIMFASSKHEITAAESVGIGEIVRVSTGKADWNGDDLPLFDSLLEAVNGRD